VDLGAVIRRSGRRTESRDPLTAGLDLAHRCGAWALASAPWSSCAQLALDFAASGAAVSTR
jgi:hypothetical protein